MKKPRAILADLNKEVMEYLKIEELEKHMSLKEAIYIKNMLKFWG